MSKKFCVLFVLGVSLLGRSMISNEHQYGVYKIQDTKHLVEIAAMINQAYKKVGWVKDTVERTNVQELTTSIQSTDTSLYACFDGEKVCGIAFLDDSDASKKLEMTMFTVHPDYQGKGVGMLLMNFIETQAIQEFHTHELYLYVVPYTQERLVAYYQRHGFEVVPESASITYNRAQKYISHLINPEYSDKIFLYEMRKLL